MNPLEDVLVALKPITPILPFPLRDSYRLMDVTMPVGSDCPAPDPTLPPTAGTCSNFTNLNPYTNNPAQTPNAVINVGWEYVWHCHILGHEENDMMRPIVFKVPPEAPSNLVATANGSSVNLTWTDNSASETGFTLQRATDAAFATAQPLATVSPLNPDANGQGITWGGTVSYTDQSPSSPAFYRVQAFKPNGNYWNPTPNTVSAWSNTASLGGALASVSPTALAFGNQALNSTSTAQTVTLSNTGTTAFTITSTTPTGDFAISSTTCGASVAANSSCSISLPLLM